MQRILINNNYELICVRNFELMFPDMVAKLISFKGDMREFVLNSYYIYTYIYIYIYICRSIV